MIASSSLSGLPFIRDARRGRASSFDTSGGNVNRWLLDPGETHAGGDCGAGRGEARLDDAGVTGGGVPAAERPVRLKPDLREGESGAGRTPPELPGDRHVDLELCSFVDVVRRHLRDRIAAP